MVKKLVVVEANEIPLKLFRLYAELKPSSTIAALLDQSLVLETQAHDVEAKVLYPSQTWASFNMGVPFCQHNIHWYNDPKPPEFPLYWKILAQNGYSLGLVNTLHSSPAEDFASEEQYKFVIPDCFSKDDYAKPSYYQPFQRMNLKATSKNGRVSTSIPFKELLLSGLSLPRCGIRIKTIFSSINLVLKIIQKKANKERLRNLQFPLLADIFVKQLCKNQPDISILFTNHVAANMHRYWYALFEEDFTVKAYDDAWVNKYSQEIIVALDLLDDYLKELVKFVIDKNSILVISSSMGQHATTRLPEAVNKSIKWGFRLEKVEKFVDLLLQSKIDYKVELAMIPQYTLVFSNESDAHQFCVEAQEAWDTSVNITAKPEQNKNKVTLSALLDPLADSFELRGKKYTVEELGFIRFPIDEHKSGDHCPEGSLLIFNSDTCKSSKTTVDYLEYAPAILQHFQIEKKDYMLEPSFNI